MRVATPADLRIFALVPTSGSNRLTASPRTVAATLALVVAATSFGCQRKATSAKPSASAAPSSTASVSATEARRPKQQPLARELVDIPGGAFVAGTRPGTPGRQPDLEPRSLQVELGPYQIDKLPFPNDPALPPLVGVSRAEAKRRCAERGTRLCTELEWERACKGPDGDSYPSGSKWQEDCTASASLCASGFEVLGLGTVVREWTASDVLNPKGSEARGAAVRGGGKQPGAAAHRCSRRQVADAEASADDLGFRCCSGAPNAAKVPEPKLGPTFRKKPLKSARLEQLLAGHPRTKWLAKDVKFFREPDAANTVVARGPGDRKGFSFTVAPMLWNPAPGAEFLLVSARSGKDTSFVVAYHVAGDDEFVLAASFVMKNEPGPIAFAYSDYIRPRLHFSDCWGCPGETGKILFRKPDSVAIFQP
jgi:formylglycine-generating enzyme required for sulfatase activity